MKKSNLFTNIGEDAVKSAKREPTDEEKYWEENQPLVAELYISNALKKRGLNQKQLAEMTGIRPAAISQLCRGYVDRLSLDHLARIGTALKVTSIEELIRLVKHDDADSMQMGHRPDEDDE